MRRDPHRTGQDAVMATVCRDAVGRWDGRVLILAHVKELLEQALEKIHRGRARDVDEDRASTRRA